MTTRDYIPINIGFNRFVGNRDSETIVSHIGSENFASIRDPAKRCAPLYMLTIIAVVVEAIAIYAFVAGVFFPELGSLMPSTSVLILAISAFVVWVGVVRRGPTDGELRDKSPTEYLSKLQDLIDFK